MMMDKAEITAQIEAKQTRLDALKESEHIAMMSDDFYYRNGGDREIRTLSQEIQELKKQLNAEEISEPVLLKAAEMYASYNGGVLETAGDYIRNYWIDAAKKELGV